MTNCWIINHFGKNPVNGGSPPKDKNLVNILILKIGLYVI